MSEWIKTSEQLPMPGIRVLVFSSSGINIAEYDSESFPKSPWTFDDLFYDGEYPTHWFPFPAFPKDE